MLQLRSPSRLAGVASRRRQQASLSRMSAASEGEILAQAAMALAAEPTLSLVPRLFPLELQGNGSALHMADSPVPDPKHVAAAFPVSPRWRCLAPPTASLAVAYVCCI
ncbi:hypothetical protein ZWY2020_033232 [Hordeum vulgare]|nr:hypothetical protein ZWY2020_033232 [Hordeum vulgare]